MATHSKPWSLKRWYAVALIEAFVISQCTGTDHALVLLLAVPLTLLVLALPMLAAGLAGMIVGRPRAHRSTRIFNTRKCL